MGRRGRLRELEDEAAAVFTAEKPDPKPWPSLRRDVLALSDAAGVRRVRR